MSTINSLFSFDPAKNEANIQARQLSFTLVAEFDWSSAMIVEDERKDYGERRYFALGMIDSRLHAVVFTPRLNKVHVISLRKANLRVLRQYEKTSQT